MKYPIENIDFLYTDNASDIITAIIGNSSFKDEIFNSLVKSNKYSKKNFNYGKFNYNDSDYIVVDSDINFIEFFNPLLTIIAFDDINNDNLLILLDIIEITNNVILCVKTYDVDLKNLSNKIGIPIIEYTNIDRLLKQIDKYNYEFSIIPNKVKYCYDIEYSIKMIKEYLDNITNYRNNRWLSMELLTGEDIIDKINYFLKYDIKNDIELIDLINIERNKYNDIKKIMYDNKINYIISLKLKEIDNHFF